MKKLIVISLGLMMFVGGCSESKGTTTCSIEDSSGLAKKSFVFTMEDDKLTELYELSEADLSEESDETIEAYKATQDNYLEYYKQYKEMDFTYEEKDNVYNGKLTYNIKEYEPEELLVDALLSDDGTFTVEAAKTALEAEGYTCTSK